MARVSDEAIQRLSKQMLGQNNPQWKGDKVGNIGLHRWVQSRLRKPELCERCFNEPPYDLANIT